MNNAADTAIPDSSDITIRYDDDWITINGVDFSAMPLLSELTRLLGTPEVRKVEPRNRFDEDKERILHTRYWWPEVGIGAVSTDLLVDFAEFSMPVERTVWEDDQEPVDPQRAARISCLNILVGEADVKTFQGTLWICGVKFCAGITAEELTQMKGGLPLRISENQMNCKAMAGVHREAENALPEGTLELLPDGRCIELSSAFSDGCSLVVESDSQKGWHKQPIKVVTLGFEDYRHPCKALLKVPLRPDEKIINGVHTGRVCLNRLCVSHTNGVDAMVTSQRLVIHSTGWDAPLEVELNALPDIEYDGLFTLPISASDFGKRLLFALIPGAIAWLLWRYANQPALTEIPTVKSIVFRYSILGLSGLMGILACGGLLMSVIDSFSANRRRTVFRSRLKTSDNPKGLCFYHGSPIRRTVVGYNTMVAFAQRVRSVVARQSGMGAVSARIGDAKTAQTNRNVAYATGKMANQMTRPIDIFFSYAHEDEELMDDVRRQLNGFDRRNIIRKWHDRQIPPGTEWKGQIDGRLQHSDIILLFITPHFIESDYCYDAEMTEAMRRHDSGQARVIPIILRPCPWQEEPFGRLQALPIDGRALTTWPNRDEGALNIAEGIMNVVRQLIVSR